MPRRLSALPALVFLGLAFASWTPSRDGAGETHPPAAVPAGEEEAGAGAPEDPETEPAPAPPPDPFAPLEPAERDTLLRLAWHTLVGHLTRRPIQDDDLLGYDLTARLQAPRGCWVTLRRDGRVRGSQGEIEPSRPLYQQVIVFVRRAATRDPRFLPLTDLDLPGTGIEIAVVGRREPVDGPEGLRLDDHGVFLEKWGRRAIFLPGVAASQGWDPRRTLEELCRNASLPIDAWASGARLEVFTAEFVSGPRPPDVPPPAAPEIPAPPADPAVPEPPGPPVQRRRS